MTSPKSKEYKLISDADRQAYLALDAEEVRLKAILKEIEYLSPRESYATAKAASLLAEAKATVEKLESEVSAMLPKIGTSGAAKAEAIMLQLTPEQQKVFDTAGLKGVLEKWGKEIKFAAAIVVVGTSGWMLYEQVKGKNEWQQSSGRAQLASVDSPSRNTEKVIDESILNDRHDSRSY